MKLNSRLGRMVAGTVVLTGMLPRVAAAAPDANPAPQRFQCNVGYTLEVCKAQIEVLKAVVQKYPTRDLGEWTWVLVKTQDWKPMSKKFGLDPDSPAFSCIELRVTFVEEALVSDMQSRAKVLVSKWHTTMTGLLDLAVRHEMGHGICRTKIEDQADHVAGLLERKVAPSCTTSL